MRTHHRLKQSYHLRISKVTFLQPEQQNLGIIILNDRGLELWTGWPQTWKTWKTWKTQGI